MEPMIRVCGHRYRNASGAEFICLLNEHTKKPNAHHFTKDDSNVSPSRLEASLESYFRRVVKTLGGSSFKLTVGGGCPDRMVLLPGGHIVLVELKANTGQLDPAQIQWHRRAGLLGVEVVTLTGRQDVDSWALDRAALFESARANA